MYRKGAQDKKRSAMFSKLSPRNHRRGQDGPARSGHERAPARRGHRRQGPVDAQGQYPARDRQGERAATPRITRRSATRASARRRRADRRGADRQPQPHRDQRPHRFLQERRQSRRQRQRQPRLRAAGPDRISGQAGDADKVLRSGDRGRRRRRRIDEDGHRDLDRAGGSARVARRSSRARRAEGAKLAWRPQTEVEVGGDDAAS
jgi:hypothetical protein